MKQQLLKSCLCSLVEMISEIEVVSIILDQYPDATPFEYISVVENISEDIGTDVSNPTCKHTWTAGRRRRLFALRIKHCFVAPRNNTGLSPKACDYTLARRQYHSKPLALLIKHVQIF